MLRLFNSKEQTETEPLLYLTSKLKNPHVLISGDVLK